MSVAYTSNSRKVSSQFSNKKLSFGGVLRSEILKFRTLTTNWVMTIVIGLVTIGLSLLAGLLANSMYNSALTSLRGEALTDNQARELAAEGVQNTVYGAGSMGIDMANMLIASVAVVFIASEYATRSIGTSLTAVPKRSMLYLAKLLVLSVYGFIAGCVFSVLGFFASYAILNQDIRAHLPLESGVFMNCLGVGLYFMMLTWMGLGFGALMRNNAAGIVLVVFCLFMLPIALALFTLGFDWVTDVMPYIPNALGRAMLSYGDPADGDLTNLQGGAYLAIWCVVPAILGYIRIRFTDSK